MVDQPTDSVAWSQSMQHFEAVSEAQARAPGDVPASFSSCWMRQKTCCKGQTQLTSSCFARSEKSWTSSCPGATFMQPIYEIWSLQGFFSSLTEIGQQANRPALGQNVWLQLGNSVAIAWVICQWVLGMFCM